MRVWLDQEGKLPTRLMRAEEAEGYAAHSAGSRENTDDMALWKGKLYRRYQYKTEEISVEKAKNDPV